MHILLLNGPNLNLLGKREPQLYGHRSFEDFLPELRKRFPGLELEHFQSNHEGELIDCLQNTQAQAAVLNAGAYTHTSIALADTLAAIDLPVVEVHLTNLYAREEYRRRSYTAAHCLGIISGLGLEGYALALQYLSSLAKAS